jgi:hypothetical protein
MQPSMRLEYKPKSRAILEDLFFSTSLNEFKPQEVRKEKSNG